MDRTANGVLAAVVVFAVGVPLVLLRNERGEPRSGTEESAAPPSSLHDGAGDGVSATDREPRNDSTDLRDEAARRPVSLALQTSWERAAEEHVHYSDVAVDPRTSDLYVSVFDDESMESGILVLGPNGDTKREFSTAQPLSGLRCTATRFEASHANTAMALDLVGGVAAGEELRAMSSTGEHLWSETVGGREFEWAADLDGDGLDELILSEAGSPAFQVHDSRGMSLWTTPTLGNGWSATAADVLADGRPEVIVCSGSGKVNLFDACGNAVAEHDPGLHASVVRTTGTSGRQIIVAAGTLHRRLLGVVGMTGAGKRVWSLNIPLEVELETAISFEVEGQGRWGAFAIDQGATEFLLAVVDLLHAKLVVQDTLSKTEDSNIDVAWLPVAERASPLLAVATRKEIATFELVER